MRNELELVSEWKRLNVGVMGMTLRLWRPVDGVNNFSAWNVVQDK
jgi:hypothetical protein